jgi:hypothetical protein
MKSKQKIHEEKVRKWIRKIIRESDESLNPSRLHEGGLSDVFIEPFVDVLRVGKMVAKDFMTHAKFTFDMLVTFDPWKINDIKNNYKKRKDALKEEWKEVMKPTYDALGTEGVHFAAFAFNPAFYVAGLTAGGAYKSAKGLTSFLKDVGFGGPTKADKEEKDLVNPRGLISKVFDGLKKVFFMEGVEEQLIGPSRLDLLTEQEKKEGFNMDKAIDVAMDELGISSAMKDASDELTEDTRETLEEIYELVEVNAKVIGEIKVAESMEDLISALEGAKSAGTSLGGPSASEIQSNFNGDVEKILNDPKLREQFIGSIPPNEAPEEGETISDDKLRQSIEKVIFVSSTEGIREQMETATQEMEEQIEELLGDMRPSSEDEKIIAGTSEGREFLQLFERFDAQIAELLQGDLDL